MPKSKKLSRPGTLLALMLVLTGSAVSSGCATAPKKAVIRPLGELDIFPIEKGTRIGSRVAPMDGWYCSQNFLYDLAEVKSEQ